MTDIVSPMWHFASLAPQKSQKVEKLSKYYQILNGEESHHHFTLTNKKLWECQDCKANSQNHKTMKWRSHQPNMYRNQAPSAMYRSNVQSPSLIMAMNESKHNKQYSCLWNTNAPFPNISRIGLTFDLLIWLSIGIIYLSMTIYQPSLKLLGQSVLELYVAQGKVNWHDLWPWPLTYWPENQ